MEKVIKVRQIDILTSEEIEVEEIIEISEESIEAEKISNLNINAINSLNSSDWKVIRELERLIIGGTDLNLEREKLRELIK